MAKTDTKTDTKTAGRLCACGCGNPTGNVFAPGHDARMVSLAVKATMATDRYLGLSTDTYNDMQAKIDEVASEIHERFGGPLSAKYHAAAMNAWEREAAREQRRQERAARKAAKGKGKGPKTDGEFGQHPDVKIGRWTYPARVRLSDGRVERNTKRDGSGEWVEYEGAK